MLRPYRYPWPASAITPEEMALLYQARESGPRMPITRLIARAIRQTYGSAQSSAEPKPKEDMKMEAA
jgi:hypothetical protein